MTTEIQLCGSPRVLRDGTAVAGPPGHKVWALLTYLVLRETPPSRAHLGELLFPEAVDPLGALRWTLTMLRRLIGEAGEVCGDPLVCTWREPPVIDVLALRSAAPEQLGAFGAAGRDLLEGMQFSGCASFEIWLGAQRRRVRGTLEALLHEGALAKLARGDAEGSAELAAELVTLNPYDEDFQSLLVRSLAVSGRGVEAARQAAACRELFRTELGIEPGPGLDVAAAATTATPMARAVAGRLGVTALLEAGEVAIGAGALEAGLECLRRAVADATTLADSRLTARAYTVLGTALVHAARGSDEEGATSLHRALACDGAAPDTVAKALSELAYIEFLRGRYDRVEVWLERGNGLRDDPAALSVLGSTLSDRGRYPAALEVLGEALDLTRLAPDERRRCYVLSMIGRIHLLRREFSSAIEALDESIARATVDGWSAFLSWPEALRAEADLLTGGVESARTRFEHAFALGCRIGDPCWEGLSQRGLGLVQAAEGDPDGAFETLLSAGRRAGRLPDAYVWVQAYILDALATLGVQRHHPRTATWIADLAAVAQRSGMVELAARAALHRWQSGETAGLDAARALGAGVENPVLARLLA